MGLKWIGGEGRELVAFRYYQSINQSKNMNFFTNKKKRKKRREGRKINHRHRQVQFVVGERKESGGAIASDSRLEAAARE